MGCLELWQGNGPLLMGDAASSALSNALRSNRLNGLTLVPTHRRGLSPKTGVASSNVATFYSHYWTLVLFCHLDDLLVASATICQHPILDIYHRHSIDFLGDPH